MFIGSLFSGIGGLELGLERAGLGPVVWQVEQDAFCRQVLAKHWPNADRSVTDVREAGPHNLCEVGIICGGFPCQDVSGAGLGAGLAGERSGLWYQFRRIVRDMQPRFVVVENVASGATRWLCEVRSGLHELGYRTRALGIAARYVGAPHRRERIFVVAYTNGVGLERRSDDESDRLRKSERANSWHQPAGGCRHVANPDGQGLAIGESERCDAREERETAERDRGPGGSSQPGMGGGSHGLPPGLDGHRWPSGRGEAQREGEPPRTVTQRDPMRRSRLRALGNAVVPQCAEIIGLVIQQMRQARV
jgi:DNA (cytosine-5)-methyltransferase 1